MRAKEYLEINKDQIFHYDIVKCAIDALCPLRNNKIKTEEYFNRYLFADARFLANKKDFVLREGEVHQHLAREVRIILMNAVFNDESFIFAYNVIVMQNNEYHYLTPLEFCKIKEYNCDTVSNIERICSLYKEDYPKNNLLDYLLDDYNSIFYYEKHAELNKHEKWWLNVFNEAYRIFDNMRLKLNIPFESQLLITQYQNEDKDFENIVVDLVIHLVSGYNYDFNEKQKKAIGLLSKLISQHFSRKKRKSYVDKINELKHILKEKEEQYQIIIKEKEDALKAHCEKLEFQNREIESQSLKIEQLNNDIQNKGFTIPQQNILYYYMFNEMGVNFQNSKKKDWAKVISSINGKNEEYIRKELSINFDDDTTINDMRIVAKTIDNLLPNITKKILNDIES